MTFKMWARSCVLSGGGLLVLGCYGWQRHEVRAAVAEELSCPRAHSIAKGPFEPSEQDGEIELRDGERLWRGSCDLAWDERVVAICDGQRRNCRVVDVGPPRMKPRIPPSAKGQ